MTDADLAAFRVFISYRRSDSAGHAGRVYDALVARFGDDQVFMDIDKIRPGSDFTEALTTALDQCQVLLVLIGRAWLAQTDQHGRRRLDDPDDLVRQELETALRRRITIMPLLVHGAAMPTRDQLPDTLRPLVVRQAMELSDRRWRSDIHILLDELERLRRHRTASATRSRATDPSATSRGSPTFTAVLHPRLALTVIALVLLALTGVGAVLLTGQLGAAPVQEKFPTVAPPDPALVRNAAAVELRNSVLKIEALAPQCPKHSANSGFVIGPELVMTTASAVAGSQLIRVEESQTNHINTADAQVVGFDPDVDVAVLRVPGLVAKPLTLSPDPSLIGDDATVLGYPLAGPYTIIPARLRQEINLKGPNIYGEGQISRDVYVFRATLQPGTGGGPIISPNGAVIGVAFAAATDEAETSFALTSGQVQTMASTAASRVNSISTGACPKDQPDPKALFSPF